MSGLLFSLLILGINVVSAMLFYYVIGMAQERKASKWMINFYHFCMGVNIALAGLSLLNLLHWLD